MKRKIELIPLETIPEVNPGDDLAKIISESAQKEIEGIKDKDIVIITSKIISKAENCLINLEAVKPSKKALNIAKKTGKPPELVQAILDHSERIVAVVPFYKLVREGSVDLKKFTIKFFTSLELIKNDPCFLITIDREGRIYSNAGIDSSNHPPGTASFPPSSPHKSAQKIRKVIKEITGRDVAVVIADTEILPFGTVDIPRGISGIKPQAQRFAENDRYGKPKYGGADLIACELTAAASLLFGQTDEGIPVVIIRGFEYSEAEEVMEPAGDLSFSIIKKIIKKILKYSLKTCDMR
ncbi:Bifunctional F420 biosynthesis protein FbiB [subsurface metagenome]